MGSPVMEVSLPSSSLVERALAPVDYVDAFALRCPPGSFADVDTLARATARLPRWVAALMGLRNAIVRVFGLKTEVPADLRSPRSGSLQPGESVGMFPILARSDAEVLMGLDDKHLEFRFSLLLVRSGRHDEAIATTLVRFRNRWGRLYFAVVKPFHRLIIPAMLRNALAQQPAHS